MNRELLEKTFSPDQIKQREGNFGKKLDYIEGHSVIHRLNDAFEAELSFSILKHEILDATDEVIVLGGLSENRSCRDTRGTFITNALDANETMGFVQNQVCHSSIKPIVNHYYNRIPRDQDGQKLEEALKNAQVLPDLEEE